MRRYVVRFEFDRRRFVRACSTVALGYAGFYCVSGGVVCILFSAEWTGGLLVLFGTVALASALVTAYGIHNYTKESR